MSKKEKSTLFTFGCIGIASVGGLLFLLAFGLPYWVDYKNDVSVNGASVNLRYTYGFWRYCNKQEFVNGNANVCDSVDTHTDVEQATLCLILVTILLYVSTLVNSALYLSLFKKEILCLYISLISIIAADIVSLVGVINFGSADHSITVNSNILLSFKASNLYVSFWLAVVGCVDAVVTTIVVILAIRANRDENPKEDETSILSSSPSRVSTDKLNFYSNGTSPERQRLHPDNSNASIADDSSERRLSSSSSSDSSSDSDDSQLDSRFAKLKFKNLRPDDRRPESSKIQTRKPARIRRRSQSVPYLPPVEHIPKVDFTDDVARVRTEKILQSVFHAGDLETNHPPPSTLISDLSPIRKIEPNRLKVSDNTDTLKRAHTEIIISKRREELPEQNYVNIEDTVIEVEKKKRHVPKFLHKKNAAKSKRPEKKHGDNKMAVNVYTKTHDIPVFAARGNSMPAPWSIDAKKKKKKQGPHKTTTSMKWALVARGVYESK